MKPNPQKRNKKIEQKLQKTKMRAKENNCKISRLKLKN